MSSRTKLFTRVFWILFSLPFVGLAVIMILINIGVFGYMPDFRRLENPEMNIASEIISSDQELLGKFFNENRTVIDYKEISPNVLNALIATEDIRFYDHSGIDVKALARVISGVFRGGKGGGSTITQQLAKNLFPRDTVHNRNKISKMAYVGIAKFKEWVTAVKLERNYTKQEILAMYLNTVPFGSQAYGIKSAAKTFFNTSPDSLKLEEAAVLIGMLKAPSAYNPKFHPDSAFFRRNTVLRLVEKNQKELNRLHGFKQMSPEEFKALRNSPIVLDYNVRSHNTGTSTYFREFLRIQMTRQKPERPENAVYNSSAFKKYIEDSISWANDPLYGWCNKHKKPNGEYYDLYDDGLKIYTTINSRMQVYAEQAVHEHMSKDLQPNFYKAMKNNKKAPFSYMLTDDQINQIIYTAVKRSERYRIMKAQNYDSASIAKVFRTKTRMNVFSWRGNIDTIMTPLDSIRYYKFFLQAGFMSIEPQTGYVRAYVGGIDFVHFKFDHVSLSRRQVGSTFKPFVYSVAMENGLTPCTKVPNIEVSFEMPKGQQPPIYTPKFSQSKRTGEMVTLKFGLASSLNQISAWIMKKFGPLEVVRMAKRSGIESPLDTVYALCVGAAEVKLSEMVGAYDTYANKGVHVEPIYVTRIEDKNGNIISTFKAKRREVLSENTAYRMIDLMKAVVDMGTSSRLRYTYKFTNEIAGKTGTTNDNSDGWFIGMTPELVSGAWVGGEERSIRFANSSEGQGSAMALPIWALFMQKVYADKKLSISKAPFDKPKSGDGIVVDCNENSDNGTNYNTIEPVENY
jgi:penicillin-binding protein 1A